MLRTSEATNFDIEAPLSLGPVHFAPRLILAPMSGVTNSAFRKLIRKENPGSVGLVVTEFISIEGLTRANKQSLRMMEFAEIERPLSIQIFGYDVDRMADAARMAQDAGADIIDINSGCPVPRVVRRGGGCELMRQPGHMAAVLAAVRRAVDIPLTLKIRSGWDDQTRNGIEIARIAENAGVDMLTVHGRTRVQLYRGESDWDYIGAVASAVKIPVVGSGDVVDVESARSRLTSGVAALMIGRGALTNPWIFSEILSGLSTRSCSRPNNTVPNNTVPNSTVLDSLVERGSEFGDRSLRLIRVLREYHQLLLEDMPEKGAIGKLKQLASQSIRSVPGAASFRRALCRSQSLEGFLEALDAYGNYVLGGRVPDFLVLGDSTEEPTDGTYGSGGRSAPNSGETTDTTLQHTYSQPRSAEFSRCS